MVRDFPTDRAKDAARRAGGKIPQETLYGLGALVGVGLLMQGRDVQSEDPQAAFSVSTDDSGHYAYVDASASTDPDGSIVSYQWRAVFNGGPVGPEKTGQQATFAVEQDLSPGTYGVRLTVMDDDGNTNTVTQDSAFTLADPSPPDDGGDDPLHQALSIGTIDRPSWVSYPSVDWTLTVSGELVSNEGHAGSTAQGTLGSGSQRIDFNYSGEITGFDWDGGPIAVWRGGSRVDPYSIDKWGGPRFRSDTGGRMIECTIRQTARLYQAEGYEPARNVADWLAGILSEHNVSHDILYDLPLVNSVTEKVSCHNPFRGSNVCDDNTSCESFACCSREDAMPGAYYWWNDYGSGDGSLQDQWNSEWGDNIGMGGDVISLRKDSNMMLTNRRSGGCASVGGIFSVAGGIRAARAPGYFEGAVTDSNWGDGIHDAVHEMGHNFGFGHPRNSCDEGGGEAWVDDAGNWNRTPCVPGNGCTNRCGFTIEPRSNASTNVVVRHLKYTGCTIGQFVGNTSGEQGQVQATGIGGMRRNFRSQVSDCEDCFDKDLETPGLGAQAARSHGGDCECGCGGCSGPGDCGCSEEQGAPQNRRELLRGGKVY